MKKKKLVRLFEAIIKNAGIKIDEKEYRFCAEKVGTGKGLRARLEEAGLRDWRFDYAWLDERVAVELEGGVWIRGGHQRPKRFISDCDKYNCAALDNWILLRYTREHVDKRPQQIVVEIKEALKGS